MIVSDALGHFLNYCRAERHVSSGTLAKYTDCYTSWLAPWLGQLEVENINRLQILDMRQAMVDRPLSIDRQYSVIMCLKGLLKFSRTSLKLNCLDPAEIKAPKRKAPDVQYLNNEEIQRMLNAINTVSFTGIRLRALVELLLSTGMRISEALSLKREPFDMDHTEVEIVGKGKLKRDVFFTDRCRYWIKQYLNKRVDDSPYLFVTTGYVPKKLAKEDLSRFFAALRKKAGINKKLTPHMLRHTFCTNLLHNGADITHIKDLAGHQDIQTTARYYLGKDKRVLRQIVKNCLDYQSTAPALPHSLEPALGPGANIHKGAFDENGHGGYDEVPAAAIPS